MTVGKSNYAQGTFGLWPCKDMLLGIWPSGSSQGCGLASVRDLIHIHIDMHLWIIGSVIAIGSWIATGLQQIMLALANWCGGDVIGTCVVMRMPNVKDRALRNSCSFITKVYQASVHCSCSLYRTQWIPAQWSRSTFLKVVSGTEWAAS